MAYAVKIICADCNKPAKWVIYDKINRMRGRYCGHHVKARVAELCKQETKAR